MGSNTVVMVTIARSGYPNGKFSFTGSSSLSVTKPTVITTLPFNIERTHGLLGNQAASFF